MLDYFRVLDLYEVHRLALTDVASACEVSLLDLVLFMDERGISLRRSDKPKRKTAAVKPVQRKTVRKRPDLDEPAMVAMYLEGFSLSAVGHAFHCDPKTVQSVLRRNDVQIRSLREAHRPDRVCAHPRFRLTAALVMEIRVRGLVKKESWSSIARSLDVDVGTARLAGLGITWRDVPMPDTSATSD